MNMQESARVQESVLGLSPDVLSGILAPLPPFRSRQIWEWIAKGARSFYEMGNLPLALREELEARFTVYSGGITRKLSGSGATVKLQITLADGAQIEAVLLSDGGGRRTACLSTQAGCAASCVFCRTGALGFRRNLKAGEIVEQLLLLALTEKEDSEKDGPQKGILEKNISNIVVMGMGEPLLNLEELRTALSLITSRGALGYSKRRITVSTCGIADGIRDLADHGPDIRLALSLTTARAKLREELMPITKSNPLPLLKESLRYYQEKGGGRITLEAVLFAGLNTGTEDAAEMAAFAQGLHTVVNLIPWNPVEGIDTGARPLKSPDPREVRRFALQLEKRGLKVTRRLEKGRDISGACGQLGGCGDPHANKCGNVQNINNGK
ncbi:MAG: 23S rRNA (adenine(2503)-C(2))-methyltransferase RlmN [Treponema sp.]|jgi:23S rRNA (adenine2503-C2)-methyltransferase|nr:23S rRNA (adenine(2503)-C(2))-methyltransferase RlmN [Treponema sp.]